jgi:protein-S-isoprenylcysteine O-methyltransferase Ste14
MLTAQVATCVLLLLSGWGWSDFRALLADAARAGLAMVIVGGVVAALLMRLDVDPLRRGAAAVGWQKVELAALLGMSLGLLWFLPFADRRGIFVLHGKWWRWVGLAMCGVGVAVRLLALKALGQWFSAYVTLQPGHRLVREGIYRWVRHPLYLSLVLGPAGVALVFRSPLALPIFGLAVAFCVDRIGKEERLLAERFGSEFLEYRGTSWKMLPGVV